MLCTSRRDRVTTKKRYWARITVKTLFQKVCINHSGQASSGEHISHGISPHPLFNLQDSIKLFEDGVTLEGSQGFTSEYLKSLYSCWRRWSPVMEHFSGGSDGSCKALIPNCQFYRIMPLVSCKKWSLFSFFFTVTVDMTLALKYIKVSYIQDLKTVLVSDLHCVVYNWVTSGQAVSLSLQAGRAKAVTGSQASKWVLHGISLTTKRVKNNQKT